MAKRELSPLLDLFSDNTAPALSNVLPDPEPPMTGPREIADLDQILKAKFSQKLKLEQALTRQLVSFQANKKRSNYRWYKYKEAFSGALVEYFLNPLRHKIRKSSRSICWQRYNSVRHKRARS